MEHFSGSVEINLVMKILYIFLTVNVDLMSSKIMRKMEMKKKIRGPN